jgi:hypothetical protein
LIHLLIDFDLTPAQVCISKILAAKNKNSAALSSLLGTRCKKNRSFLLPNRPAAKSTKINLFFFYQGFDTIKIFNKSDEKNIQPLVVKAFLIFSIQFVFCQHKNIDFSPMKIQRTAERSHL